MDLGPNSTLEVTHEVRVTQHDIRRQQFLPSTNVGQHLHMCRLHHPSDLIISNLILLHINHNIFLSRTFIL